jgi:hypothetical protein
MIRRREDRARVVNVAVLLWTMLSGGTSYVFAAPPHAGTSSRSPGPTCIDVRKRGIPFSPVPATLRHLSDVEDTWIVSSYPSNVGGAQAVLSIFSGPNPSPGIPANSVAVSLLRFNVAKALPKGANIESAEVVLQPTSSASGKFEARTIASNWHEATATSGTFSIEAGATSQPFRVVPVSGVKPVHFDATQQVIDWLTGSVPNYGILLRVQKGGPLGMASSEAQPGLRPYLRICYWPSPCAGKPDGQACEDSRTCTGDGTCQHEICNGAPSPAGTICRRTTGKCDIAEVCDGTTNACPNAAIAAAGTTCRPSSGVCDAGEECDGASVTCPIGGFLPPDTVCRPATPDNSCDVAENCTGYSAQCPPDRYKPAGMLCRPAAPGGCDMAESCSGTAPQCPPDKFQPAGTLCRPAASSGCDVAESCSGTAPQCPPDKFQPAGTQCAAPGPCNIAANCTGSTAQCPPVSLKPDGESCGGTDVCSGGRCISCGQVGYTCCPGAKCTGSQTICACNDQCVRCGNANEMCCSNDGCPSSTSEQTAECVSSTSTYGQCLQCGKEWQRCCVNTNCEDGLVCYSNTCRQQEQIPPAGAGGNS